MQDNNRGSATFFFLFSSCRAIFPRMANELTAAQVAERLGMGRSTVNKWCRLGKFSGARQVTSPVGDYWLIPEKSLDGVQPPPLGRPTKAQTDPTKPKGNGTATGTKKGVKK
jgi:hypothetical protein